MSTVESEADAEAAAAPVNGTVPTGLPALPGPLHARALHREGHAREAAPVYILAPLLTDEKNLLNRIAIRTCGVFVGTAELRDALREAAAGEWPERGRGHRRDARGPRELRDHHRGRARRVDQTP